jgi:16S rRNA processing protein RimM
MAGGAPEHLIVGTVQKPHGVRGELFVKVETDRPDVVFAPGRVLSLADASGKPLGRSLTVERARAFKGGLLLKAAEIAGRTPEVEELRGHTLLIAREEAAPLEEGEVFVHDLVGMEVRSGEEVVGTVHDVYESPGGYLLAVRRPGKKGEMMVPFVEAVVGRVDIEGRVLELVPLPGLLEL